MADTTQQRSARYNSKNRELQRQRAYERRQTPKAQVYMRSPEYLAKFRVYNARSRQKLREEIWAAYGTECACCGEARKEFLSIDHIDGGGCAERRAGGRSGVNFYARLRMLGYPEGYRTLCHNCNQTLGFHGYCPHDLEREG